MLANLIFACAVECLPFLPGQCHHLSSDSLSVCWQTFPELQYSVFSFSSPELIYFLLTRSLSSESCHALWHLYLGCLSCSVRLELLLSSAHVYASGLQWNWCSSREHLGSIYFFSLPQCLPWCIKDGWGPNKHLLDKQFHSYAVFKYD